MKFLYLDVLQHLVFYTARVLCQFRCLRDDIKCINVRICHGVNGIQSITKIEMQVFLEMVGFVPIHPPAPRRRSQYRCSLPPFSWVRRICYVVLCKADKSSISAISPCCSCNWGCPLVRNARPALMWAPMAVDSAGTNSRDFLVTVRTYARNPFCHTVSYIKRKMIYIQITWLLFLIPSGGGLICNLWLKKPYECQQKCVGPATYFHYVCFPRL